MRETADAAYRTVGRVIDRGTDVSTNDNKQQQYGPLTGEQWLELDHWAFQELPRHAYDLFRKLVESHGVPVDDWHDGGGATDG